MSELKNLEWLDINECEISGSGFSFLQECKSLSSLNISSNPLNLDFLPNLMNLKELKTFYAKACGLNDYSLTTISKFTKLEELSLPVNQIYDEGLNYLQDLSNLKILYLGGTQVTDVGVVKLISKEELEKVRLIGVIGITDSTVRYLCNSKHKLKAVDFSNTGVSANGIRSLRRRFPNLLVNEDFE